MTEQSRVIDKRTLPIFLHSDIDDAGLTLEEFRVYAHLARRAGKRGGAFPNYRSIGEKCFRANSPEAKPESLQRRAMKAVKSLVEKGFIVKNPRYNANGGQTSNDYELVDFQNGQPIL